MKRILNVIVALAMALMLGACSMSMDTIRYATDTDKVVKSVSCDIPAEATKIKIIEPVMFDYDKSDIRADQVVIIDKVAEIMENNPDIILLLDGYASTEGSIEYNLALSDRRVNAVNDALVEKGVAKERIATLTAKGEVVDFGEELSPNRRVMILSVE